MANKTYTIVLTEEERNRIVTVLSCNLDLNMIPNMQEHAKLGNTQSVISVAEAIKFDRDLVNKLIGII